MGAISRVLMDLRPGERLSFAGEGIEVEVIAKSGRQARLCVTAPRRIKIEKIAEGEAALPASYQRKAG